MKSLSIRQALLALVSAVVIGLALTGIQGFLALQRERQATATQINQIMDLLQGPAANALWNYDNGLAEDLFTAIRNLKPVERLEIRDSANAIFAASGEMPNIGNMADRMFGDILTSERSLFQEKPTGETKRIGTLILYANADAITTHLRTFLLSSLISDLLRDVILGLVLAVVFHFFLTRPLIKLGRDLVRVRPTEPLAIPLRVPAGHSNDELGYVASRVNELLGQLHRSQTDLRRIATHDPLTGMPNRIMMSEILADAVRKAMPANTQLAVLLLDLDRFKHINDSLGHGAGDKLLREVGHRLQDTVQDHQTVGRLGGDEFLIVLDGDQSIETVAATAKRLLAQLSRAFTLDDQIVHTGASIGVAMFPQDGADALSLMRHADVAMYAAKGLGGGAFKFFNRAMTERAIVMLRTEASLRDALCNNQLEVHYQPKIRLEDGKLYGAEALVRWPHGDRMISPAEFIPVAEETGLIIELGDWVLRQAAQEAARWRHAGPDFTMAVNVSARQLLELDFPERASRIVQECGMTPNNFILEVTESAVMRDVANQLAVLNALRAAGFGIAVDDFGTGYSSLSYLRQLPVTMLKIDRSFVIDLPEDNALASTVISLGQKLGLTTIAEGVETREQLDWLRQEGCILAQGYLISKPLPAAQFVEKFLSPALVLPAGTGPLSAAG